MEPGIYRGMTNTDYHAHDMVLSKSMLARLERSAAHLAVFQEPSRKMDLGSGAHVAILQPERFEKECTVLPDGVTLSHKEGKAIATQAAEEGKALLTQRDHAKIKSMASAVHRHTEASVLLRGGEPELSVFWRHPVFKDVLCKCRPDYYRADFKILAELKTTADARPEPFSRVIANMKYHWQAAWYLDGVSIATGNPHTQFVFIVVEVEPPHGVMVYFASPEMIEQGRREVAPYVEMFNNCVLHNHWPCYQPKATIIDLPTWARKVV